MKAIAVLDQFKCAIEEKPNNDHNQLLDKAYQLVQKEVIESNYSIESVRLAHKIFGYLGDHGLNERVTLMEKYIASGNSNSVEDQFWANWELVDNLALLKKYDIMIDEQIRFWEWTKEVMPQDYLLNVMFDSTQAVGWFHENRVDEWFDLYSELIHLVVPSSNNRKQRILLVETASGLLIFNLKDAKAALKELKLYEHVLNEDPTWSGYNEFFIRLKFYQLSIHSEQEDWENYDKVVEEAMSVINHNIAQLNEGNLDKREEVCDMAHEIGTCLMWEKRYEQAIPLFEFALQNQGTGITHFFYAICIWPLRKDRKETIHHLKMAENKVLGNGGLRSRYIHMFLEQPEFSDVRNDEEFLAVFKR